MRLGYQFIDHQDFGVQEDEVGTGYGFTLGYKRYFKDNHEGLHAGIKSDMWFNSIDWETANVTGTSDIIVVQPTAEIGYLFSIGQTFTFTPSVAFGREINVQTKGAEVGHGFILLVGLNFGKRF